MRGGGARVRIYLRRLLAQVKLRVFPEPWMRWYDLPLLKRIARLRWVGRTWYRPDAGKVLPRLRTLWLVLSGHETEICNLCGWKVGAVWHAPDPLWWRVNGGDGGCLCPSCFTKLAEAMGISPYWSAGDGVWPECSGQPCAHEESMMIVATQRDELWRTGCEPHLELA